MSIKKDKLDKFKKMFLTRQEEIIRIQNSRAGDLDQEGDETDLIQTKLLKDVLDKLSQKDKQTLKQIEKALLKIEQGRFGICEDCEEPIGDSRLNAIPFCDQCIDCAELAEKEAKQYRNTSK